MALWKWSGHEWNKCPWHSAHNPLTAVVCGTGESLNEHVRDDEKFYFVLNHGYQKVRPDVWVGLDKPALWADNGLLSKPFCKVLRGNMANDIVYGKEARLYPNTYWADIKALTLSDIFNQKGIDAVFHWSKNSMTMALQLAVWMGFKRIELVGVNLGGESFNKLYSKPEDVARQNQLYDEQVKFFQWFHKSAQIEGITVVSATLDSRLNSFMECIAK